jgi:DALR anticodon binding domain
VIAAELRRAILIAAGQPDTDPLLRPGPQPGTYISSLPFHLAPQAATALAARLAREPWIAAAGLAAPGYLTVTVTREALACLAVRIARAGPACAVSDALAGCTLPGPARTEDLAAAPDWPSARAALAEQLTARLAAAAGATVIFPAERPVVQPVTSPPAATSPLPAAIAYAGRDAVRFTLARMPPGGVPPQAATVARQVLSNPAYAVQYAHAAAAAVLRWAASLGSEPAGFQPRLLMAPHELALLDAMSWLPERVATAARRGRPDEFAGYLEELAARTIDTMSTTGFTTMPNISSERLWLADAARTGLAAGLGLLGVGAPERI